MRPGRADRPHAMTPWAGSPARAQSPCRGRLLAARVPRIAPCPPGRRAAAAASLPACHASPRARPIACSALLPARHKDGGWTSAVSALLSGRSRRSFSQPPVRMPTGLGRPAAGRASADLPAVPALPWAVWASARRLGGALVLVPDGHLLGCPVAWQVRGTRQKVRTPAPQPARRRPGKRERPQAARPVPLGVSSLPAVFRCPGPHRFLKMPWSVS